jgi:probable biosynthetic protein (TIGR04098 family)
LIPAVIVDGDAAGAGAAATGRARLRIGMPQLCAGGLSEGWLLRHAGDLHWQAICRRLAVASDEIRSERGQRLYPTFVALRARYQRPLWAVEENDAFAACAEVIPTGKACAHGRVVMRVNDTRLTLELLSTFAVSEGSGRLRMDLPAARLAGRWGPAAEAAAGGGSLAALARAARRGEALADPFCGPRLDDGQPPRAALSYQPSPYVDYNGAGLLYFAAYVTIADSAERTLVHRLGLRPAGGGDWALASSPVRRDVFYYCNLPLGEAVTAELRAFEHEPGGRAVKTRVRLTRQATGEVMADLVTRRLLREVPR